MIVTATDSLELWKLSFVVDICYYTNKIIFFLYNLFPTPSKEMHQMIFPASFFIYSLGLLHKCGV